MFLCVLCVAAALPQPGNITVADVLSMLPYANALSIFSISGQVLIDAVKHGASGFPNSGRFLQVSGIRYYHNNGAFLSAVFLNPDGSTSPINPAKSYTIVATDYMLQGGDGYQFTGANVILPAGEPYAELVMADMKQHPEGVSHLPSSLQQQPLACLAVLCRVGAQIVVLCQHQYRLWQFASMQRGRFPTSCNYFDKPMRSYLSHLLNGAV